MLLPNILPAAFGLALALTSPSDPQLSTMPQGPSDSSTNVPILEVVKVYGKLAGSICYGKIAPQGSSCQIRLKDLPTTQVSREEFASQLQLMEFQWPLKPYGINDKTLVKTAVVNKGAETYVFMSELESRKLYDARNPTSPLPTSLRPALNKQLQTEGILDARAIDLAYEGLRIGGDTTLSEAGTEFMDYYDFLKKIGPNSISWPKY
jgi:hypothetical protein